MGSEAAGPAGDNSAFPGQKNGKTGATSYQKE